MPDEVEKTLESESAKADWEAVNAGLPDTDDTVLHSGPRISQPEVVELPVQKGMQQIPLEKAPADAPKEEAPKEPQEAVVKVDAPKLKTPEEFEQELSAIVPPKNASPKTLEGWAALHSKAKEADDGRRAALAEVEKYRKEAEETKAALQKSVLPKEVEEELNGHRQFRQMFDLQNDATAQFDAQMGKLETEALDLMKEWQMPEATEKYIASHGGLAALRFSQKLMDGAAITEQQWFEQEILGNLDGLQKRSLEKRIEKILDLHDEKSTKIREIKANPNTFIDERKKQWEALQAGWTNRATKVKEDIIQAFGDVGQKMELKPEFTTEQAEQANKHNAFVDKMHDLFPKLLNDNTPESRAAIVMGAIQAQYLVDYAGDLQKKFDAQTKELAAEREFHEKVTKAGRTAKQSNAPVNTNITNAKPLYKISDLEAMKELDKL